jgi:hypothetical protein
LFLIASGRNNSVTQNDFDGGREERLASIAKPRYFAMQSSLGHGDLWDPA